MDPLFALKERIAKHLIDRNIEDPGDWLVQIRKLLVFLSNSSLNTNSVEYFINKFLLMVEEQRPELERMLINIVLSLFSTTPTEFRRIYAQVRDKNNRFICEDLAECLFLRTLTLFRNFNNDSHILSQITSLFEKFDMIPAKFLNKWASNLLTKEEDKNPKGRKASLEKVLKKCFSSPKNYKFYKACNALISPLIKPEEDESDEILRVVDNMNREAVLGKLGIENENSRNDHFVIVGSHPDADIVLYEEIVEENKKKKASKSLSCVLFIHDKEYWIANASIKTRLEFELQTNVGVPVFHGFKFSFQYVKVEIFITKTIRLEFNISGDHLKHIFDKPLEGFVVVKDLQQLANINNNLSPAKIGILSHDQTYFLINLEGQTFCDYSNFFSKTENHPDVPCSKLFINNSFVFTLESNRFRAKVSNQNPSILTKIDSNILEFTKIPQN